MRGNEHVKETLGPVSRGNLQSWEQAGKDSEMEKILSPLMQSDGNRGKVVEQDLWEHAAASRFPKVAVH